MNSDKLGAYCWHDLVTHRVINVVITSEDLEKDHHSELFKHYIQFTLITHLRKMNKQYLPKLEKPLLQTSSKIFCTTYNFITGVRSEKTCIKLSFHGGTLETNWIQVQSHYLNSSVRHIALKPCPKATVRETITFHPLMGFSPSLCSDSFDDTHLPQVNLQPLPGVSILCYPGASSSVISIEIKTRSVRSVVIVVRRRSPKMPGKDSAVFHTQGHNTTI